MPTNISNGFQHPLGDGTLTKTNDGDGYYVALGFDEFNEDIGAAGSYHLGEDWMYREGNRLTVAR